VQETALTARPRQQEPRLTAAVHIRLKSQKEEQTINNILKTREIFLGNH
jgi:hypothetical protein